jgi:hypothetical protein
VKEAESADVRLLGRSASPLHEESLILDPRVLLDARFLGVLHRELRTQLDEQEAEAVLLQTGFFHGLHDARLAIGSAPSPAGAPVSPLLAMTFVPEGTRAPGVALRGLWPERLEAEAMLATLGKASQPACSVSAGYTSGWLSGIWDTDILALETSCAACGEPSCGFVAREAESWCSLEAREALRQLRDLPFSALREVVSRHLKEARESSPPLPQAFDPASPAIHVWGPVMVIPYSGEETASSVEVMSREPSAGEVSVVVIDLSGALLDEGFAAIALERTLDVISSWGAEPVLAGVSPLSEPVIAGLERPQLVVRKDLEEAIAAAFQIVELQKHPA